MPQISVIVPVYKVEPYIRRCVDSILAQTFTDFELILVDDGSPDNCPAICDEYAEKNKRVRVIHQQNQGQSAARNHAVAQASAEWLCFVDSDDVIHPQFIEVLYNAVKEYPVQMSMCGAIEAQEIPDSFWKRAEIKRSICPVNEDYLLHLYKDKSYRLSVLWAKLLHKDLYGNVPLVEGRIYEDSPSVCKWFLSQKNVVNVDCDLYFYRVNPTGITKSAFSPKQLDRLWAFNEQIQAYDQAGYYEIEKAVFSDYVLHARIFYHNCLKTPEYRKTAKSIKKQLRAVTRFVKRNVDLSFHDKLRVWSILYPRTMKICCAGKAPLRKIMHKLRGRPNAAD